MSHFAEIDNKNKVIRRGVVNAERQHHFLKVV